MKKMDLVFNSLKNQIESQIYKTNDLLPSEHQLADEFKVSRETVRKTLQLLQDRGYIQKLRGKGSMVINQQKHTLDVSGIISYQEFSRRFNLNSKTKLISLKQCELPISEFTTLRSFKQAPQVIEVKRVRIIDEQAQILDIDYLDTSIISELPQTVAENSLYNYFENKLNLKIAYAQKEITVAQSTSEDRMLLDLQCHEPIAVVKSITSLDNTETFQYTISRHCASKFRFQDFARRN